MELEAGSVVDRYTIESVVGEGGLAVVYRARHNQLDTLHALKVLTITSRKVRDRMLQEGRVQASLRHVNIVSVTDVVDVGGAPCLVMEYIQGPTLDQLLRAQSLSVAQLDNLAEGIIRGVACAHHHEMIHRDLKPANIMLSVEGGTLVPKITDFGLAKLISANTTTTRTGATMGTPHYMSPEQIRDAKTVGKPADIFAVGAILYEMVTRKRAFDGDDMYAVFNAVIENRYVPVKDARSDVPTRMAVAIQAALQVDPKARPKSCDELLSLWAGRPMKAYQKRADEPTGPWDHATLSAVTALTDPGPITDEAPLPLKKSQETWLNETPVPRQRRPVKVNRLRGPVTPPPDGYQVSPRPQRPAPSQMDGVGPSIGFTGTHRYVVRRLVGSGAVGMVYEGYDRERKTVVALKTLEHLSPGALYRFKQEFRSLAEIKHQNLASLHELVAAEDVWFIAMELVRGVSFFHYIRGQDAVSALESTTFLSHDGLPELVEKGSGPERIRIGPASLPIHMDRVNSALVQLLQGCAALHAKGRLHRDIKPSNVLVTPEGRVVLVDFGLVYDTDRSNSELSRVEKIVGTAAFMAPEQAMSVTPAPSSDMYSVGVMLYQALTGKLPFEGSLVDMLMDKQVQDPRPPSEVIEGIPPLLDNLCLDLLRRNPAARPTAEEALERLGVVTAAPKRGKNVTTFLGRDAELQVLEDAWTTVRNGRSVTVMVDSEAGMGKTALVKNFLGQVKRFEEVTILRGRCFERESVPFKAFDALMDGVRRKLKRMEPESRDALLPVEAWALAKVFPVLKSVLQTSDSQMSDAHPAEIRSMALQASRDLIRNLCRTSPVVVFIDDVQWGDLDSARMLVSWLSALSRSRLLVVLAFRSEEAEASPFLSALMNDPVVQRAETRSLTLEALTEEVAVEVARRELGPAFPKLARASVWAARESNGHPNLIHELCRSLTADHANGEEPKLDRTTLGDLLRRRYVALPEKARAFLLTVAVAGRPLPLRLLAKASGVQDEIAVVVDKLKVERLIRTTQTGAGEIVETYHSRVGPPILDAEGDNRKARVHEALAQSMEREGWADAEALMQHMLSAGQREKAGTYALRAAESAMDGLAFDKAAELYRTALALTDPTPKEALEIQVKLADSLAYAGRGQAAAEQYLALDPPDAALRASLRRRAAEQYLYNGYFVEGQELVTEALANNGLQMVPDSWVGRLRVLWIRALLWMRGAKFEARPEGMIESSRLDKIDVCWFVGMANQLLSPMQGYYFHSQSLFESLRSGEEYRVARAQAMELVLQVGAGRTDWDTLRQDLQAVRQRVGKLHNAHASAMLLLAEGMAAYLQGHFKHAYRVLRQAERAYINQTSVGLFELAIARIFLLRSLLFTGDLRLAAEQQEWMIADAQERGNLLLLTGLRSDMQTWVLLAADEPHTASQHIKSIHKHWDREGGQYQVYFLLRGEVSRLLYEGRADRAMKAFNDTDVLYNQQELQRLEFQRITHEALRGQAALALAAAGDPTALRDAKRALRAIQREGHRTAAPYVHLLQAGIHAQEGQTQAAIDELEKGLKAFDRIDMLLYANACRWAIGLLRNEDEDGPNLATAGGWLRHQGVVDPGRFCQVFAPGFSPPTALARRR